MSVTWYRYCRHGDLVHRLATGWRWVTDLGGCHGEWSSLVEYAEEWRAVVGYEEFYQVSSLGEIRSLDRMIGSDAAICGYPRMLPGRLRRQQLGKEGYLSVMLSDADGRKKRLYVAAIVANAFIGDRPDGYQVCHNDGNRANNAAFNLRYDTRLGNESDKIKHGTQRFGERVPTSKLTAETVMAIRRAGRNRGLKTREIAKKYGVSQSNISMILAGRTWQHLPVFCDSDDPPPPQPVQEAML